MDIVFIVIGAIVGACIGSFVGCAFYRIPNKVSLIFPSSHCPACKHTLAWYENIPIISYMVQCGKARCCNAKMSVAYFFFEALFAAIGGVIGSFIQL